MERPVTHLRQLLIVCDDKKCLVKPVSQVKKKLMQVTGMSGIQVPSGLICKNNIWFINKSTGYSNSLLLSTGKGLWFMLQSVSEAEGFQQCSGFFLNFFFFLPAIQAGMDTFSSAVNSGKRWWN